MTGRGQPKQGRVGGGKGLIGGMHGPPKQGRLGGGKGRIGGKGFPH